MDDDSWTHKSQRDFYCIPELHVLCWAESNHVRKSLLAEMSCIGSDDTSVACGATIWLFLADINLSARMPTQFDTTSYSLHAGCRVSVCWTALCPIARLPKIDEQIVLLGAAYVG
mmetsp:Transcript_85502/g.169685  ORF Transcript_85502/g.169685 Transcript_85502/m.169685 type:complete len:115 (-) Transcript_85502:121-465(-)